MAARKEVWLDPGLVADARRIAKKRRLPSLSGALYHALSDAVRLARTEHGRHLLPLDPGRTRTPGGKTKLAWTQSDEELEEWVQDLEAVGSSPRAVLGAWLEEYVRVDGDLPAMRWPFRMAVLATAS